MSDRTTNAGGEPKLTGAFRTMPKWKVLLLVASLVIGAVGIGGEVAAKNLRKPQTVVVTAPATPAPATPGSGPPGSSGFIGGGGQPTPADQQTTTTTTTTTTVPAEPSLTDKISPGVAAVGFSFFVGLIVGVITRAFLKIAVLLAGLAVAAVVAAHYFNINIDLSAVQAKTGEATTWLSSQLGLFKDFVIAHLPSAGGATAGFLFGMKRR